MQRGKIAVEENLTPIRNLLREKGYQIVSMDQFSAADCVVVTGGDDNLMGIQTTLTQAPVIAASGKTAEEIVSEIERHLR